MKKSDTVCSDTHPACNITIEDASLPINERFRIMVSSPSYLTIGLTLEYFDEKPAQLTFKNVNKTVPYEFYLDLSSLSSQALKPPRWPMFGVLYDAVLKTIMNSKMPDYCVLWNNAVKVSFG